MKRTINFDNPKYLPVLKDKNCMKLLLKTVKYVEHTANIFRNRNLNKLIRDQKKWIRLALKDPLLNEEKKKMIREIDSRFTDQKTDNLFSSLATDLKPLFDLIASKKLLSKRAARLFLLEAITKFLPDYPELATDKRNELEQEDRLKKHLQ